MRIQTILPILMCHLTYGFCFNCNAHGLFPNFDDPSCRTYIYCFKLMDNLYIQKQYDCEENMFYNTQLKSCDKNYTCDSSEFNSTATPTPDSCTSQGRIPDANDTTCSFYYYCYYLTDGNYVKVRFKCPSKTMFDPLLQTCSSSYQCNSNMSTESSESTEMITTKSGVFECSEQGKFAVENDTSCSSYHNCLFLSTGRFIDMIYRCEPGKKFDEKRQTCSQSYICPAKPTTPIILTTETVDASTSGTDILLGTSNIISTTNYKCTTIGYFPIEEEITCRKYYYCFYLPNGQIQYQIYSCIAGEAFDPVSSKCSKDYQCSITSTSPSTTTPNFKCSSPGNFPIEDDITCRTYYYCFYLPNGQLQYQIYGCIAGEAFDPVVEKCSKDYKCSITSTTPTTTPDFKCTLPGNFPIEDDSTCRTYYYCFYLPNGQLQYQIYSCIAGETFDPMIHKCSKSYKCSSTSTSQATTTPDFRCTSPGNFPIEGDVTCRTYYYCFYLPNGKLQYQIYSCIAGEAFDPVLGRCTKDYQCSATSTSPTTTTSDFKCASPGNFPIEKDVTCRTYYYCFYLPDGELIYQIYSCIAGESFDPVLHKCSKDHQCSVISTRQTTTRF